MIQINQRTPTKVISASGSQRRPGDWSCVKCSFHNFASRALCYKCDNRKPQEAMRPGDWICECKSHNYVNRETCFRCSKPKPTGADLIEPVPLNPVNKTPQPQPPQTPIDNST